MTRVRLSILTGVLAIATAISGCSSVKDMFGGTSSSASSTSSDGTPSPDGPKTAADFDCPPVEIRSGASTLSITGAKADESGSPELRYQGSIIRNARECTLNAGIVGLRVGIEGRIIVGPAGGPGQVDVPIRVAVVHEGPSPKTVATKLYRTTATVGPDQGNSTFSLVVDDLSFPMPRGGEIDKYVIYLGFDPQPEARPRPAPRKPRTRSQS